MVGEIAEGSLTRHLVSLRSIPRPYSAATEHPFLSAAGLGTLNDSLLALWLSQDRIYAAHAYPRFIGLLISKIPFCSSDALDSREEEENQRVLKILAFSLDNVVREAAFFQETSQRWHLDMECWKERKATRDYTAEMTRVSSYGSLEDGLVFLWAMEQVSGWLFNLQLRGALGFKVSSKAYLDAWRHVASLLKNRENKSAISSFAENWTSPEFEKFVSELAGLVDGLGIQPGSEGWKRAQVIWARIVELEESFWPEEGEELTMRLERQTT